MTKITILLIALHFVSDQLIQPTIVKKEKHKNSLLTWAHVLSWSIPFFLFSFFMVYKTDNLGTWMGWYSLIVFLHFLIEWPINRMSTMKWYDRKLKDHALWSQLETILTLLMILATFHFFKNI